ncbi:acyl carrier protein [Emcibacter sp.]|uniref:acyl carrier protein n=1 Tax=Emcibacter sp. TaxID=1979954 RepID=UPI002AA88E72|nr:acyl carrier protein [Emcibacter sp.]
MTQNNSTLDQICTLIKPFNKKGIALSSDTTFSTDLELDSLAVMDLLAEIEDHFDITVPLNILPDLEKVGQVADAVDKILSEQ